MGRLCSAKCTIHFISAHINQEELKYTKAKKYLLKVSLTNLYTVIEGELDPSMYTMNPTVGDTTFLPTVTTTNTLEETPEPSGQGGQFPTLNL